VRRRSLSLASLAAHSHRIPKKASSRRQLPANRVPQPRSGKLSTHRNIRRSEIMADFRGYLLSTAFAGALLTCTVAVVQADDDLRVRPVLLLSIDGFHQHDLANCLQSGTCPALAKLAGRGVTYTNARTTTPSDSFPGLLAQLTGGTPKTTGVYYDDSYDRTLFSPGPAGCHPSPNGPGSEIVYDETIDFVTTQLLSGGINPAFLPQQLNPDGSCTKVWPHDFLKVNTIFGVAHAAGLQTA